MSATGLATIGTVLGGVMLLLALPVLTRIGSVAILLISTVAGAIFFHFLGRAIAKVAGGALWPDLQATGDLISGGLPLRALDQAIFGGFICLALMAALMVRNEQCDASSTEA